jgi:hypothetical protein
MSNYYKKYLKYKMKYLSLKNLTGGAPCPICGKEKCEEHIQCMGYDGNKRCSTFVYKTKQYCDKCNNIQSDLINSIARSSGGPSRPLTRVSSPVQKQPVQQPVQPVQPPSIQLPPVRLPPVQLPPVQLPPVQLPPPRPSSYWDTVPIVNVPIHIPAAAAAGGPPPPPVLQPRSYRDTVPIDTLAAAAAGVPPVQPRSYWDTVPIVNVPIDIPAAAAAGGPPPPPVLQPR